MSAKVSFFGNLTRDPEMAQAAGQNVCRVSVAVRTSAKDQEGNYITNFYDVSLWGRRGDYVMQHAQKGTVVFVNGDLAIATYLTKDGSTKAAIRVNADTVEPLARLKGDAAAKPQGQQQSRPTATEAVNNDDYIPF